MCIPDPVTQRKIVLAAMRDRPADPWPRGTGHVVLGVPGSPREQKAYHEPGGGFSPSPGSFGVSVWWVSSDGSRVATSDDIPFEDIRQHFEWTGTAMTPWLVTKTPYYHCRWALHCDACWQFELHPIATGGKPVIWIRSAGPAGAPIESMGWDGRQLIINHRWIIECDATDTVVTLADENERDWAVAQAECRHWESSGWGCARIEFAHSSTIRLKIRDTGPWYASPLAYSAVKSALSMDLPDANFAASLDAQATHLLMGFVGRQTCPGEPTNYPLAWERDGAYSVIAMARAGQIETAKELAVYFASNDFFGGFGAEGDAPGSAINVLVTVALIADDPEFTRWIWPHVKRKTVLIEEMLAAEEPVKKEWLGPIVPEHLDKECIPIICQPAEDGLIVGSMDLHYPVLYINAFTRRGLLQAAKLAGFVGEPQEEEKFTVMAESLRQAWMAGFDRPAYENERTFMSALWPTWMIGSDYQPFVEGLRLRWQELHKEGEYPEAPLWTYFTAAEAHQWLYLDRPDHVWKTLHYFWRNQCSPGLYTYWEGIKEENTFGLWQHIRGWVTPQHVTPHYWTAAEMLLLQLDMLTYVSEAGDEPVLVIGACVPAEWLAHPISVKGQPTIVGLVDWSYGNGKLNVTIRGKKKCSVRAGASFGRDVAIHAEFQSR